MRVNGLIEAPELAACLTLSKNDFIRTGPARRDLSRVSQSHTGGRGAAARPRGVTRATRRRGRAPSGSNVISSVCSKILADEFPLLRSLVDHRAGGQKRLPWQVEARAGAGLAVCQPAVEGCGRRRGADTPTDSERPSASEPPADAGGPGRLAHRQRSVSPPRGVATTASKRCRPDDMRMPAALRRARTVPGRRRPARYGLMVQFESRPDDTELGRLVDSTIWINDAHPAYTRAAASRSAATTSP